MYKRFGRRIGGRRAGTLLRLLFYLPSLAGGGAERLLALLATELVRRGHIVTLAVDTDEDANAGYLDPHVRVERLGADHGRATLRLARLLRRTKPDVSMSALGGQNLKLLAAALLVGQVGRTVQSHHGFYEGEPKLLSRLMFRFTPVSSRLMARTVAVSDGLRDELRTRFGAYEPRLVRIYNGVPLAPTAAIVAKDDPAVVLACGRMTPDKNYPFLLRAFARMARTDAQLVILGEGPERARVAGEITRLGLNERVSTPGYCETAPYYARASCFAMTSVRESFGLVVVEALAAGLPVVTTASGGPPEVLDGLGTVVDQGDEAGFATALDAALEQPGDAAGRRARAAVFSMEGCTDAYERLFTEVARRR